MNPSFSFSFFNVCIFIFSFIFLMPFFISAAPPPPPSPPPTPPPPPPFDHHETPGLAIFIILLALVANTVIVCLAHQSQEETPPTENQQVVNPQAANQQGDEAQKKAKKTVIKYVNLVATIFLFLISMLLQYKFKKPIASEVVGTIMCVTFIFVGLGFFLKSYFDFGHIDFIMGMMTQYLIYAIKTNHYIAYSVLLFAILLCFSIDNYYKVSKTVFRKCKEYIEQSKIIIKV